MKNMLSTRVVRRIEEIPKDEWDKVFPDVLDGYSFFKSIDESDFKQFSFRYILVYDKDTLVGVAPCFVMNYPLDTSISGPIKHFIDFVRRCIPNIFTIRSVVCGVPMGQGKIGIAGQADEVVRAICACMNEIARDEKAPTMAFKDFGRDYTAILDTLLEDDFSRFDSLPSAEMEINFKNFDQYLMGLSHATRYDLRRKFKKVDGHMKMEMDVVNRLTDEMLPEVYRLYLDTIEKHDDIGFEIVPIEFFKNISRNMPEKTRFFLWRMDKKLVAFVFALASEDFLSTYYLGLDYSIAYQYHLYFTRFRDMINWCIDNKIKRCDVGVTGYEPKKRLKFGFVPLYIYAKHRNRFIRPFFKAFCNFLKFEHFDPVLKEIKGANR